MTDDPIARGSTTGLQRAQQQLVQKLAAMGVRTDTSLSLGTVVLVVDCSDSMCDRNKLQQARDGAKAFLRKAVAGGYAAALVSFSSSATRVSRPTTDLATLDHAIDRLIGGGSTNLAAAIRLASEDLRVGPLRTIVLVTDGQPDDRPLALDAARSARDTGITIIAVGTDDADTEFLRLIASATELAIPVSAQHLASGIQKAAAFLPTPQSRRDGS